MNKGKVFERALSQSVPDYALLYRLPDPAQSFGERSSTTRFSRHNVCDFFLFDSKKRILYAIEAKTVSGKSISFERNKGESGDIHYFQIEGLNNWNKYNGVVCGLVIEFREIETTVFIEIDTFNKLIAGIEKKSFNYGDLQDSGLPYSIIPQKKKRTQYTYDIDSFLKEQKIRRKKNG